MGSKVQSGRGDSIRPKYPASAAGEKRIGAIPGLGKQVRQLPQGKIDSSFMANLKEWDLFLNEVWERYCWY
jgi:hypothetical protein